MIEQRTIAPPTQAEVLKSIWDQSEGDHVFLPFLQNGVWVEENSIPKSQFTDIEPGYLTQRDQYFTPLCYVGPQRRKGMLGKPGVIYADLDGDHVEEPRLEPSVIIATSNGHYHAYWYLDEPADPTEWEQKAKGWSYAIGADPGGWDATQVLRVPGSFNHKNNPPTRVLLTKFNPEISYPLTVFPSMEVNTGSVGQPEPIPSKKERDFLIMQGIEDDRLPLSARYWLTADQYAIKALGKIDRSKVMWQVEKALYSVNYTPYEVFNLMYFSGINKFFGRPDRLWHEVLKAAVA